MKKVVLAIAEREYAAKLAEYLRDEEKAWEVAAYTNVSALRRELRDGGRIDALIGQEELIGEASDSGRSVGTTIVLTDAEGRTKRGERKAEGWLETDQYQPLPALLSAIRDALGLEASGSPEGCRVWTVFSASGGSGKTTVALNLVRQAGESGLRVLYLNLEALNATSLLFGTGEPDSLSRLLYVLQAHPEQWEGLMKQSVRHQAQLKADYLDAPEHPGERLALTPELTSALIGKLKAGNRYDLIVVDPDSGADEWHRRLLEMSDRIVWLALDDAQSLLKAEKLLAYWRTSLEKSACRIAFAVNKGNGGRMVNRWGLPGKAPSIVLPYIPQWKTVDQPGRLLSAPAFEGAAEELLNALAQEGSPAGPRTGRGREHVRELAFDRGVG